MYCQPTSDRYLPTYMTNLTTNQRKAVEAMPATAREIADILGYKTTSGVYDLIRRAGQRDPTFVFESEDGVWDYIRVEQEPPIVMADGGTVADDPLTRPHIGFRPPKTRRSRKLRTTIYQSWNWSFEHDSPRPSRYLPSFPSDRATATW